MVDLAAGGEAGGDGRRRTLCLHRVQDDNVPPPTHLDPNHPANRRTQQMPQVTPDQIADTANDPNAAHNRQTQRQMPAVGPVDDQSATHDQTATHDPNAAHNRQTQRQMPAVTPTVDDQQQQSQQESEYQQATRIWRDDQTSAGELKAQIDEEEWETALGHVKEARQDPEVGPTIAHIPDHQLVALYLYTDYHYRRWNLALRENDPAALRTYAARIKAADDALAQLPN